MKLVYQLIYLILLVGLLFSCSSADDADNIPIKKPEEEVINVLPSSDLYGLIKDQNGKALKNVVVSDGYSCVLSNSEGVYQMKRHRDAQFVFYSTPSGYGLNKGASGIREYFKKINVVPSVKMRADFILEEQEEVAKFKILAIADPQVRKMDEINRFQAETLADIKKNYKEDEPVLILALGDIVFDKQELLPNMKGLLGSVNFPYFVTIGNHDKFVNSNSTLRNGDYFSSIFGPLNYSFNVGNVHFVCLDNIAYSTDGSYTGGFQNEQISWLTEDLSYVPTSSMIVIFYHIPIRDAAYGGKRAEIMSLLKNFNEVHLMAGHTHYSQNFIHSTKSPLIYEHIHGAACGHWWDSNINGDGTPNGYAVYEVNGNTISNWYYKSVNYDWKFQFRLHRGSDVFGGSKGVFNYSSSLSSQIVANVWNIDPTWSLYVYEDGKKMGSMVPLADKVDAWSLGYHHGILGRTGSPTRCNNLYYYTLKNPLSSVEVLAIDRFGNEFKQTEIVTDLSTAFNYK